MAAVLLFTFGTMYIYVEAAECNHPTLNYVRDQTIIAQQDSTNHFKGTYQVYKCSNTNCNYSLQILKTGTFESHTYYVQDKGHSGNRHHFADTCRTCGYVKSSFSTSCSGPPCAVPYRLDIEE